MTNSADDDDFEFLYKDLPAEGREYMQRYCKPDGYCLHCGRPANQYHPTGPIVVTISAPDADDRTHEFCNWECFAAWAMSKPACSVGEKSMRG